MKNKFLNLGKILMLPALMSLHGVPSSAEVKLVPPGYMLTKYIDDTFILDSSLSKIQPSVAAPLIESYIRRIDPKRDGRNSNDLTTKELSKRIAGAAFCLEIDPFVFAALIRMESILYDQYAVSPTGAVGYTQFTSIAAKEVSHQLGMIGERGALENTTDYLTNVITGNCLAANGGYTTMGINYKPLWKMSPAANVALDSKTQAREMAKMMDEHPEYALVYGAILMKVNLSLVKAGIKSGRVVTTAMSPMKSTYSEVLMMYNGDPAAQIKYQKLVLLDYYPAITGTSAC